MRVFDDLYKANPLPVGFRGSLGDAVCPKSQGPTRDRHRLSMPTRGNTLSNPKSQIIDKLGSDTFRHRGYLEELRKYPSRKGRACYKPANKLKRRIGLSYDQSGRRHIKSD
jgi:hypothetical protein